jgi:diguanylate cyclase (GGDEF)-like protein
VFQRVMAVVRKPLSRLPGQRPDLLVFLPAVALMLYWWGGERYLVLMAFASPLLLLASQTVRPGKPKYSDTHHITLSGGHSRTHIIEKLDQALVAANAAASSTACFVVCIDDEDRLSTRYGRAAEAAILTQCSDRIRGALRQMDTLVRLDSGGFAVCLDAKRRLDIETVLTISSRFQEALSAAISLNAARIYITASVGFCLSAKSPKQTGEALLDAAQLAADAALRSGPSAIRSFDGEMITARDRSEALRTEMEAALNNGEVRAYFQPQVSTETGAISGFEALARWHHPERGVIAPGEFLPIIEDNDLSDRLGEVMLYQALFAMKQWDKEGFQIPCVAVNFSSGELRNPLLVSKLKWELDRFDLEPKRLCVEILENVVAATENDIVVSNISGLAALGCGIDLDDFGTGHASITSIRRFAIRRIKVDRSFVTRIDKDPSQQKMVAAILSMAEQLGLATLAEGVETVGEHTTLAQLGCSDVQGYSIAKPMPFDATTAWIAEYRKNRPPQIQIKHRAR